MRPSAGADGSFTTTMVSPLAPGTCSLVAVAIDAGGNYGQDSTPFSLTILA